MHFLEKQKFVSYIKTFGVHFLKSQNKGLILQKQMFFKTSFFIKKIIC